jgi:hypothetical protein
MRENGLVFSLTLSEGFANISFDYRGDAKGQFLNDEGYASEIQTKNSLTFTKLRDLWKK